MRTLCLLLLCALSTKLAKATAIVAVVFPSAVYIAADSRLTKTAASDGAVSMIEGCKIARLPEVAFAVSALASDSRTGFNFAEITRTVLDAAHGTLEQKIDAVEAALAPKLQAAVDGLRVDFPRQYETFSQGKVGQALFAAWEDGRPVLIEEDWAITPEGDIRSERSRATPEQNLLMIGSGGEAMLRYVNKNTGWWKVPPPEALERMVSAAIDDAAATHADDVGGEIAIVAIDAAGQRWERAGKCGPP